LFSPYPHRAQLAFTYNRSARIANPPASLCLKAISIALCSGGQIFEGFGKLRLGCNGRILPGLLSSAPACHASHSFAKVATEKLME
jgi:hypothetical protein